MSQLSGGKLNSGCKESTVTGDAPNHLQLDELEPYTEYKVAVVAHLGTLNISKEEKVVGDMVHPVEVCDVVYTYHLAH